MQTSQKILIVRLSAIGDVVHSLPVLHALKTAFPCCQVGWAVEDRAADILINNPLVDKVHVLPKSRWKKRGYSLKNLAEFWGVVTEIRKEKYDIAIDLQELFKSGLVSFLSGAKRRIAHRGAREFADIFANEKLPAHDNFDPEKLIIRRYLEPAEYLGAKADEIVFSLPPSSEETVKKVDSMLSSLVYGKEIAVFAPATIWPSKHWKEEYWAELLNRLSDRYNVVFIGTEKDNALINRITSLAGNANYFNFAGKTTILELIELFNRTKFIAAPDTGPAHIANATQKPAVIMIFGSTGVRRTPPIGEKHSALSAELLCQPCFRRICPRKDAFMECMENVTPDMVLDRISRLEAAF